MPRRHPSLRNRRRRVISTEVLEQRTLLTTIDWGNRGVAGFNAQSEAVIDRAIADWERAIVDLNDADGDNTFTVDFLPGTNLFGGVDVNARTVDSDGVPESATILVDNNAGGFGWYVDTVAEDDGEFDVIHGEFSASQSGGNLDLYTSVSRGLGQALGFWRGYQRFDQLVDANDQFNGPTATASLNGSLLDSAVHPNSLLDHTSILGHRELVSDLELNMLSDAFDYTVLDRSDLNSMYVVHDAVTGDITARGLPGASDDTLVVDIGSFAGNWNAGFTVNGITEQYGYPLNAEISILVSGGGGNDSLSGGFWQNGPAANTELVFDGGDGDDTMSITGHADEAQRVIARGGAGDDVMSALWWFELYGEDGDDSITLSQSGAAFGGAGNDTIVGGFGSDTLYGEAGNDEIRGEGGADSIFGGDGSDSLYGGDKNDTIYGDTGDDFLWGDADHDSLHGGDGADEIRASSGNDQLFGQGGNDSLWGGSGNDNMRGNSGNDELYGASGLDTLTAGSGADYLSGGTGADTLTGGTGIDELRGGSGNDLLYAGTGNTDGDPGELLFGDGGTDTAQGPMDTTDQLFSIERDRRFGGFF